MNIIQGLARNLSRNHPNGVGVVIDFSKMPVEDAILLIQMLLSSDATRDMSDLLQELGSTRINKMLERGALKGLGLNPAFANAVEDINESIAKNDQNFKRESDIAKADQRQAENILAAAQKAEGNANDLEHPVDTNQGKKNGLAVPLIISGIVIILIMGGFLVKLTSIHHSAPPTVMPGAALSGTQTASAILAVDGSRIATASDVPATQIATKTSTVTPTDSPTPAATGTDTTTPTPPLPPQVIPAVNAYCRKGPGTLYDQVTILLKGTAYDVIGRDDLNSWWQVKVAEFNDCWVGNLNVSKQGPVEQAEVVQGLPLPGTPASFDNSFVCDIKLKTFGVDLSWDALPGATGFRIYRNGDLLTTAAVGVTSYHDNPPLGVDLVYELEAFNANGVAVRISTNVSACK